MSTCREVSLGAYESLRKICKDRHAFLRISCVHCGKMIEDKAIHDSLEDSIRTNLYFYPLKLACETKEDNFVRIALGAIQELIALNAVSVSHVYKKTDVPIPQKKNFFGGYDEVKGTPKKTADDKEEGTPLIVIILHNICMNATMSASDAVLTQVIRGLLTIISSPTLEVHGKYLMLAMRTIFTVSINTRSNTVLTCAKAALSTIVSCVLEMAEAELNVYNSQGNTISINTPPFSTMDHIDENASHDNLDKESIERSHQEVKNAQDQSDATEIREELQPSVSIDGRTNNGTAEHELHYDPEDNQTRAIDTTNDVSYPEGKDPNDNSNSNLENNIECDVVEDNNNNDVDINNDSIILERKNSANSISSPVYSIDNIMSDERSSDGEEGGTHFSTDSEKDCILILRSLSKQCVSDSVLDSSEYRGCLQGVTLLFHAIMTVGDNVRMREPYRFALQRYVARSLLQNSVCCHIDIARISLKAMQKLISDYRQILRRETIVFVYNVLFPILESKNSSFELRLTVLKVMESFVEDGQSIMDHFVNFDCNVTAVNLMGDFVNKVSKIAQESHVVPSWISPRQDVELRNQAVRIIGAMTSSLLLWMNSINVMDHDKHKYFDEGKMNKTELDVSVGKLDGEEGDDINSIVMTEENEVKKMIRNKKSHDAVLRFFNKKKPADGIDLAVEYGIIPEMTPEEVAKFLLHTKGLDKIKIGEYLSANKPFVKDVLVAFFGLMNFKGMVIDEAMRFFLGKFKIQGEAETVDRTMERFAQRYCDLNPGVFSSSGTCYVLAFSIILLSTDAHSVHVKEKMTVDGFIRNNRGIDDGNDISAPFLREIYHRITTNEIKLENDEVAGGSANVGASTKSDDVFTSLSKKKAQEYKREANSLVRNSIVMLTKKNHTTIAAEGLQDALNKEYISAATPLLLKAFWDVVWSFVLRAFSTPMEEATNKSLVDSCLSGFDSAISLNCIFRDASVREEFITSLASFTHLADRRALEYKNLRSIVILMQIARREGNALQSSWVDVLKCISLLDKFHIINGEHSLGKIESSPSQLNNSSFPENQDPEAHRKRVEQFNTEFVSSYFDLNEIDRIFSKSRDLDDSAIVNLVESLCKISVEELAEKSPRTYSLQKLVEVAEINISRLRYVWSKMWVHLSQHFITVGISEQLVAMFVVDSLRQLAVKFLSRDELGSLGLQRDFLKPFELIAGKTPRTDIRELVIDSLGQMVDARASNIMSGWYGVMNTLGKCAGAGQLKVVSGAAQVLQRITLRKLYYIDTTELLTDLVNAWSAFGGNCVDLGIAETSIQFIRLLSIFAKKGMPSEKSSFFVSTYKIEEGLTTSLSSDKSSTSVKTMLISIVDIASLIEVECAHSCNNEVGNIESKCVNGSLEDENLPFTETFADFKTWLSIFASLSSLTGVQDHTIRSAAITAFFDTIHRNVDAFKLSDWALIIKGTVQPVFDKIFCDIAMIEHEKRMENDAAGAVDQPNGRSIKQGENDDDFRAERNIQIRLLELGLKEYFHLIVKNKIRLASHFSDFLNLLVSCPGKFDPQITNAGIGQLHALISDEAVSLSDEQWSLVVSKVGTMIEKENAVVQTLEASIASNEIVQATSTIHALVRNLICIGASLDNPTVPPFVVLRWMELFLVCHKCAITVLDSPVIDKALHHAITGRIILDLQRESSKGLLKCFGRVPSENQLAIEKWIIIILRRVLHMPVANQQYQVLYDIVILLLQMMRDMTDEVFQAFGGKVYGPMCGLIRIADPLIGQYLSATLLRFGCIMNFYEMTDEDLHIKAVLEQSNTRKKGQVSGKASSESSSVSSSFITHNTESCCSKVDDQANLTKSVKNKKKRKTEKHEH